jgi:5'-nucleotidase
VQKALESGFAAASIVGTGSKHTHKTQLRIAFDGDAVLFSDEAEKVYQQHGIDAFSENEEKFANVELKSGPFKCFLKSLHNIQSSFPEQDNPIRTALVTARGAPSHKRVIHTMRAWDIRIDESFFLGGLDKGMFLKKFGADIFFDDQHQHCQSAAQYVSTGHVPNGIAPSIHFFFHNVCCFSDGSMKGIGFFHHRGANVFKTVRDKQINDCFF